MNLDASRALKFYLGAQESLMFGLRVGTMVLHLPPNGHLIDDGWIAGRMDTSSLQYVSYTLQASTLNSSANGGDNTSQCAFGTSLATTLVHEFGDVLASGVTQASAPCDAISVGLRFHGVRAKEVRVAPASLAYASPDCGGAPAVIGTMVPEEATCGSVRDTSPGTCGIRPWSSAD